MLRCSVSPGQRQPDYMTDVLEHLFRARRAATPAAAAEETRVARALLPGCVTQDEMAQLGESGLVDCDVEHGNRCESTCGSPASFVSSPAPATVLPPPCLPALFVVCW